jgi:ABC-type multidrug transport system fused ATPase/permease subunit
MAKIIDEQQDVHYQGNLFKRLMGYAKPYYKQVILCLVLVLALTAMELKRPMLLGDAIDLYIEGYNEPYAIVDENEDAIYFEGNYYQKNTTSNRYGQMVYDGTNYYFFTNLTPSQSQQLYELSQSEIKDPTFEIDGEILEGQLLSKEDCDILRQSDLKGVQIIAFQFAFLLALSAIFSYIQTMTLQR